MHIFVRDRVKGLGSVYAEDCSRDVVFFAVSDHLNKINQYFLYMSVLSESLLPPGEDYATRSFQAII
jgi:hypothetical protein